MDASLATNNPAPSAATTSGTTPQPRAPDEVVSGDMTDMKCWTADSGVVHARCDCGAPGSPGSLTAVMADPITSATPAPICAAKVPVASSLIANLCLTQLW